jgi:hypothetical protein
MPGNEEPAGVATRVEQVARGAVEALSKAEFIDPDRAEFARRAELRGAQAAEEAGFSRADIEAVRHRATTIANALWNMAHSGANVDIDEAADMTLADHRAKITEPAATGVETSFRSERSGYVSKRITFSASAYERLERLAKQTGGSLSDVLRDAIALKVWFENTHATGGHVLVEHPDGKIQEVVDV